MLIKTKILALVATMATALLAVTTWDAWVSYGHLSAEEKSRDINGAATLLVDAAGAWAVERGTTAGVLGNGGRATAQQRSTIEAKRVQADAAMAEAVAVLTSVDALAHAQKYASQMAKAHADVVALRQRVDAVMSKGSLVSDRHLPKEWFPAITGLIVESAHLREDVEVSMTEYLPADAVHAVTMRDQAWRWAEYAGRERGKVAGIIARGERMSPQQAAEIESMVAVVHVAMESLDLLMGFVPANIAEKIKSAEASADGELAELRTKIEEAGLAGRSYPVSSSQWFATASSTINDVLAAATEIQGFIDTSIANDIAKLRVELMIKFGLALIALLGLAICWWMVTTQISRPMDTVVQAMERLSRGDLDTDVPTSRNDDEIGKMYSALARFRASMVENEEFRVQQREKRMAAERTARDTLMGMADEFETALGGVTKGMASNATQLAKTASRVSSTAEETAQGCLLMQEQASEASAQVDEVAAAANELNSAIAEVAHQVGAAAGQAESSSQIAAAAANRVQELNDASTQIQDVLGLISSVADQTNMLALNATIEAARAGEHGKGFAVVASEVKALANQTQAATEQISNHVENMLAEISSTSQDVRSIADGAQVVQQTVGAVAAATEEQRATTSEITRAMESAAARIQAMRDQTERMSTLASTTSQAVSEVSTGAGGLSDSGELLQRESSAFLDRVRA
ncbi:MAG: methyl-accepting chemotaxis protein [Alphaproteobacteria bacterium]|nr:methyl-accepting chemotaxis protein [Alphaproteobacteria bacterium]